MASTPKQSKAAPIAYGLLLYWLAFAVHARPILTLPSWSELTLELSPALTVTADLKTTVAEDIQPSLIKRPGALQPQETAYHLRVETHLKWFLSSKTWQGELWLKPDLTALQRTRFKRGPTSEYKIYRYAERGVYRIRHQPQAQAGPLPETEHFYPFPENLPTCRIVSDPYAILLLLSQPDSIPDKICIFNKQGLYQISFQLSGFEPVQVHYRQNVKPHRVQTQIQAQRVVIRPLPLEIGGDLEPFEFLGMEGEIAFLRDPKTHLPLQIEGQVPGFGRAKLQLTKVKLR